MPEKILKYATVGNVKKYAELGENNFCSLEHTLNTDGFDIGRTNIEHFMSHNITNLQSGDTSYHNGIYDESGFICGTEDITQHVDNIDELDEELAEDLEKYIEGKPDSKLYVVILPQNS